MPQAANILAPPHPPGLTFGPKTITQTMRKLRAWKADPKVENEWPEPQSAHACAVQTHLVTFRKKSKYRRKCAHFGSPFRSFWVPFSRLSPTSGPRAPRPRPKVGTRYENGPHGWPKVVQGCPNVAPRSHKPCPLAFKSELPHPRGCQIAHLTGIRASRHPSIQASGPRGRRQRR